ncbi:hypothetical protein XENOCAPTIV_015142 [Xenoophorus captivus]|uniref:Uncharacterized protein n=1 Tax=Xenoophorus captivus TaxID=1517983 RepID=A0ABV0SCU4_9TELE
MLFAVYALCMYALYSFMPVVVKLTSATAVNLSLLTADLFSLFCGLLLFNYKRLLSLNLGVTYSEETETMGEVFSVLYIISFVIIMMGFIMFNAIPTYSALHGAAAQEAADPRPDHASDRLLAADGDARRAETGEAFTFL